MTFYELLWYFSIYSFLGWCMEVVFCTVRTGKLVNRGFLNGPVCPIYGFGMVIVLAVLGRFSDNIALLFFGGMVLTSALELVGGWALKKFFHTTWWDYSEKPLNIGGYICLQFSLAWGVCVVLAVRFLHRAVEAFVHWIPFPLGVVLLCILMAYFLADTVVTVLAVCRINRNLTLLSATAAQRERMQEKQAAHRAALEEKRAQMQQTAEQLRAEWIARSSKLQRRIQRRLLRAFPRMRNERDGEALRRVRAWLEEKRK